MNPYEYCYFLDERGEYHPITNELQYNFARESNRGVVYDTFGDFWISTIFTIKDLSEGENAKPLVFETAILKKEAVNNYQPGMSPDIYFQDHYSSYEDAWIGHHEAVKQLMSGAITEPIPNDQLKYRDRTRFD
jgi:hypothetical protein